MAKLDDYLTIQECAELLGCSHVTVWRWVNAGRIRTEEKFGRTLIHRKHCQRPKSKENRGAALFGRKKTEAKP